MVVWFSDLVDYTLRIRGIPVCFFFVDVNVVHDYFDSYTTTLSLLHIKLTGIVGRYPVIKVSISLGDAVESFVLDSDEVLNTQ